jgi:peptide/nickel transport system substrate-binding protein
VLAGCGDDGAEGEGSSGLPATGGGGRVAYAMHSLPTALDPLEARNLDAQVVSRQVHEPLVTAMAAPYGGRRQRVGLATALRPSADSTVWTVALRRGVRFQDGTPFDAAAVIANSRRWASSGVGARLLLGLIGVDSPRPGEVRFVLEEPEPELPLRLADPRLGIVSPEAFQPQSGAGARFQPSAAGTGTGPFVLEARGRDLIELTRNPGWWGSPLGLGPALDTAGFRRLTTAVAREAALRDGEVQIAGSLPPPALESLDRDPLLRAVPGLAGGLGTQASVRGLDRALGLPLLSGVWLTTLPG